MSINHLGLFKFIKPVTSCLAYENFTTITHDALSFGEAEDLAFWGDVIIADFAVSQDGSKLLILADGFGGLFPDQYLVSYDLITPFDVSSATNRQSKNIYLDINSEEAYKFWVSLDGMNAYIETATFTAIYAFTFTNAWDISTATLNHSETVLNMIGVAQRFMMIAINSTGSGGIFYYGLGSSGRAGDFTLSTPYDLRTWTTTATHQLSIPVSSSSHICDINYTIYWDSINLNIFKTENSTSFIPLQSTTTIAHNAYTTVFLNNRLRLAYIVGDKIFSIGQDARFTPRNLRIESFTLS